MASFFSKLFGGGSGGGDAAPKMSDPVSYEGLVIRAAPVAEGSQYRLSGVIIKEAETGDLQRNFVRADIFTSREEAEDFTVRKGKQIIDEQGKRLFADGAETGRA